jgi:hypothetical protein
MRNEALRTFTYYYPLGEWEKIETPRLIRLYELWRYQPANFRIVAINFPLEWNKGSGLDGMNNPYEWGVEVVVGNPSLEEFSIESETNLTKVKVHFNEYGDAVAISFKGWAYRLEGTTFVPLKFVDMKEIFVAALPPIVEPE